MLSLLTFLLFKTLDESDIVVVKEEKITDKDRARCLYSHQIMSIPNTTRMKLRLLNAILQNTLAKTYLWLSMILQGIEF